MKYDFKIFISVFRYINTISKTAIKNLCHFLRKKKEYIYIYIYQTWSNKPVQNLTVESNIPKYDTLCTTNVVKFLA